MVIATRCVAAKGDGGNAIGPPWVEFWDERTAPNLGHGCCWQRQPHHYQSLAALDLAVWHRIVAVVGGARTHCGGWNLDLGRVATVGRAILDDSGSRKGYDGRDASASRESSAGCG
jgi:hypothetical protein